jgi:hypothetical protein
MKKVIFQLIIAVFTCGFVTSGELSPETGFFLCKQIFVQTADSVVLNNLYFRVMRNATHCSPAYTPGFGTRVIVALDKLEITGIIGPKYMKRGDVAVFPAGESYRIPTGEYFEVSIKTDHPPLTSPEKWVEPLKNAIVYEDEQFRVFEERLAPGDTRELHSHAQRLVVRLNQVRLTDPRTRPEGSPGGGIQVANTVKFAEPVVHVVKNLSPDTPLFNIVIEFKLPKEK